MSNINDLAQLQATHAHTADQEYEILVEAIFGQCKNSEGEGILELKSANLNLEGDNLKIRRATRYQRFESYTISDKSEGKGSLGINVDVFKKLSAEGMVKRERTSEGKFERRVYSIQPQPNNSWLVSDLANSFLSGVYFDDNKLCSIDLTKEELPKEIIITISASEKQFKQVLPKFKFKSKKAEVLSTISSLKSLFEKNSKGHYIVAKQQALIEAN